MIAAEAPVETFDEIDSTLLEARRRAERGELAPVWLTAKRQTAGRGRRGRAWASYEGNLLATLLGTTTRPPADIAMLGFVTGLAISETMDAFLGATRAQLKWPNDVLIEGAKASGIMLDSGGAPGGTWFALAFGVNLAEAPEGIDQPTVSLGALLNGVAPQPLDFLAALRPRLHAWCARFEREGFAPLRDAWLARAYGLGAAARVASGATTLQGRIVGLSPRGELEFETGEGTRLISAGDVLLSQPDAA